MHSVHDALSCISGQSGRICRRVAWGSPSSSHTEAFEYCIRIPFRVPARNRDRFQLALSAARSPHYDNDFSAHHQERLRENSAHDHENRPPTRAISLRPNEKNGRSYTHHGRRRFRLKYRPPQPVLMSLQNTKTKQATTRVLHRLELVDSTLLFGKTYHLAPTSPTQ